MEATSGFLVIVLPVLLLAAAVMALVGWRLGARSPRRAVGGGTGGRLRRSPPGAAALVVAWLLATVITLWCGYLGAFVVVHVLLFSLGPVGAWVGLIAAAAVLVSIPFAWGRVILS